MDYRPIVFMSVVGLVGCAVFHGHPVGKDCFICPYRGLAFIGGSLGLGVMMSFSEN